METSPGEAQRALAKTHYRFGWALVLGFLLLGILLEAMHGFKVSWYLAASEETRRLMMTLAHAHGVLLGLLNIGLASTVHSSEALRADALQRSSLLLRSASLLMPIGFLLGGLITYGGDPGFGVFLVAPGAFLLAWGVLGIVREVWRAD